MKNKILLFCLIIRGSVLFLQGLSKEIEEDIFETYMDCINRRQAQTIFMHQSCDESANKQGATRQEITRCKAQANMALKEEWEGSGCACIGRVLQHLSKN
jgi:hypothetical protein